MPGIEISRRIKSGGGEDRTILNAVSWSVAACTRYSTFSSSCRMAMSSGVSSITRIVLLPFSAMLHTFLIDERVDDLVDVAADFHKGIRDLGIEVGSGSFPYHRNCFLVRERGFVH